MRKIKLRTILILLFIIGYSPPLIFAQFEDLGVGARGIGMSNAFTGLSDDVYAIYYNPAGLSRINWKEIGLNYEKLYWGLSDNSNLGNSFVAYAHSFNKWGTIGIGWLNFGLSRYYSEDTFMLAYGRQVRTPILGPFGKGSLRMGLKLKILSKEYGKTLYTENAINLDTTQLRGSRDPVFNNGYSKTGFGLDLGLLYDLGLRNSVGLVLNDINQPNMGLNSDDRIHFGTKLGYAYKGDDFNMTTDFIFRQEDFTFCAGAEKWFISKTFAVRGGLGIGSREYTNLSFGGSWRYNGLFQFDYSFCYPLRGVSNFYGSHQLSLTLRFGPPETKEVDLESEVQKLRVELENAKKEADEAKMQSAEVIETKEQREKAIREAQEKQRLAEENLRKVEEELRRVKLELEKKVSEKEMTKEEIKQKVEKHYTEGMKAYSSGDLERSIKELESAVNLDPANKEIRIQLERARKEIKLKESR